MQDGAGQAGPEPGFGQPTQKARCRIIAEAGTAHAGSIEAAKELIHAAAEAGADAVKFQMVYADEILHPNSGLVPLPGGDIALYERFKALEQPPAFFARLKEETEARGLVFVCSPFGLRSARELAALGLRWFKIASPELNHLPLLRETARLCTQTGAGQSANPPWPAAEIILSSGVSTLADIEEAIGVLRDAGAEAAQDPATGGGLEGSGGIGFALSLLHCVTAYPAPPEDYNLSVLAVLQAMFGVPVGVSDHSLDARLVPGIAAALGACIIEKHICLDRARDGLDDPIALPPADFARMCNTVRELDYAGAAAAAAVFGDERTLAVLGRGVKTLAPAEAANYGRTNRSLHALSSIRRGEVFTLANVAVLRTEKVLRPGLHPRYLDLVLGKLAERDIPNGEGIVWDDVSAHIKYKT